MKLTSNRVALKIFLALSLLGLAGCGGTDPNDSAVAAQIPTCKIKSNWLLLQKGYTVANVVRILGYPNQQTVSGSTTVYNYEDCRMIVVVTTPDDPETTTVNELKLSTLLIPGTATFVGGYLASFESPKDADGTIYYEYTDAEVLAYQRGQ